MSKISTYAKDLELSGTDKFIGTDTNSNNATKNFTINNLAAFLNSSNKIESQALRYVYQDWQVSDDRLSGSISFDSPQPSSSTLFSAVTSLKFSKFEKDSAVDVSGFYTSPLIGNYVIITKASSVSEWAIYTWNSSVQDGTETSFYDIGLSLVSSSGSLTDGNEYLVSLLQLSSGGSDKNYVHTESPAASVWTVTHNLNKYCDVTVVDNLGAVINADIGYDSLNQVTITFNQAVSGQAFCN